MRNKVNDSQNSFSANNQQAHWPHMNLRANSEASLFPENRFLIDIFSPVDFCTPLLPPISKMEPFPQSFVRGAGLQKDKVRLSATVSLLFLPLGPPTIRLLSDGALAVWIFLSPQG